MSATLAEQICTTMVADQFVALAKFWPGPEDVLNPESAHIACELAIDAADWILRSFDHIPDQYEVVQLARHWLRLPNLGAVESIAIMHPSNRQECLNAKHRAITAKLEEVAKHAPPRRS